MSRSRAVKSIGRYLRGRPINLEISQMKNLSIIAVAILLGLGGAAMASDSGENHQDDTNSTGANPLCDLQRRELPARRI
jgi:hypothetical protein